MDDTEFEHLVNRAVSNLPDEFKEKLDNVAVVTADWPTRVQTEILAKRGERGLLLGLYQGIPQTKRRNYGIGPTLPDKITIFKYPILRISASYEDAIKNIKDTVIHEIAHHFGMSEEEIHKVKTRKG